MNARVYDPNIGRFSSADPIGFEGGINLYGYANGNPINITDPSGLMGFGGMPPGVQGGSGQNTTSQGSFNLGASIIDFFTGSNVNHTVMGCCGPQFDRPLERLMPELLFLMPMRAGASVGSVVNKADEAFHYTFSSRVPSIESQGLRPGQYATPNGNLSPLQAQIDLALPPNRGLTDSVLRVDLAGLRSAGYTIPEFTPVGRSFNMPGGGYEVQFPYAIPPEFIKVVPK